VIEFGLVGQTMHAVDERVPVADLVALTAIYRRIIDRYFGLPAAGAVARVQRVLEIVGAPFAAADMFERADHRAHLMVQEAARGGVNLDFVAHPRHVEPLQRAHRARPDIRRRGRS
jgi:hypothetical protein